MNTLSTIRKTGHSSSASITLSHERLVLRDELSAHVRKTPSLTDLAAAYSSVSDHAAPVPTGRMRAEGH